MKSKLALLALLVALAGCTIVKDGTIIHVPVPFADTLAEAATSTDTTTSTLSTAQDAAGQVQALTKTLEELNAGLEKYAAAARAQGVGR